MKVQRSVSRRQAESKTVGEQMPATGIFVLTGEFWNIDYGGISCTLKNSLGLSYVQRLLQYPGEEFSALQLLAGPKVLNKDGPDEAALRNEGFVPRDLGDLGPMLDLRAKQEFKRVLDELKEEVEDLHEKGLHGRAQIVQDKIDSIQRELVRSLGLGGRDRRLGSDAERARINVTRAIRAAIQRIGEHNSTLGQLLEESIRTGSYCRYLPTTQITWEFALGQAPSAVVTTAVSAETSFANTPELSQPRPAQTTFVGRGEERALLRDGLRRALNGDGSLVMITGPAGIGKTRLAREIATDARSFGFVTLAGNCYDREDSVPFISMVEILEAALGQMPNAAAFRAFLGPEAAEITRLMPQMRRDFSDIPAPLQVPPEQARRALFNALVEIISRQSRSGPLLLLIEDMHWADEGTLAMIAHFARALTNQCVLLILTYRDDVLDPTSPLGKTLAELVRARVGHVRLSGLPPIAVTELVEILAGRQISSSLIDAIYANTDGNPLFVVELVQHLVSTRTCEAPEASATTELDLPDSLRLVIGRRLAGVSKETQKMLGTAAVIGRSFTFALLEAATRIEADQLIDLVEEAEKAGLISSHLRYPDAQFTFAHELIRRAVLDDLSMARRQRLHLNVAHAIELLYSYALQDHAEDLAHHLWNAGAAADPEKTIHCLQSAATKAVQTAAHVEAIGYLKNALKLLSILPKTPEHVQKELLLQTALGTSMVAVKGFSSLEVRRVYARASEISQQIGQSPQFFLVVWGQWIHYASRSEYEIARRLGEQCLQLAEAASDPALLIEAHHALGVTCYIEGEFAKGLEHFDQVVALYNPERHASHAYIYGQDPAAICHIHAGNCLWSLGYPDQASKRTDQGLALGRRVTHPGNLATIAAWAAMVKQFGRDARAVQELAATAVDISIEHNFAFVQGIGAILGGWALVQLGQSEEGVARMKQGLEGFRATDAVLMMPYFSALLAEAYGNAGRAQEGVDLLAGIEPHQEPYWEAELHRIKGELILRVAAAQNKQRANHVEAENCFRRALAVATAQHAKSLELRAATSLSRLWLRQGRRVEAANLITKIVGWFTEGFDTPDLQEAKALITNY